MAICHLQATKTICALLKFGKTFLSTSHNIFLMLVLTSMFDPRAPTLAAVEEERKTSCNQEELNDMREHAKKRRTPLSRNEPG